MDIRNCTRCKNIYNYDGFKICHNCRQADEADFQTIKEYLDNIPGANVSEVAEGTGIDPKKIIEFLKEGRLEMVGGGSILLECEVCGAGITTGRFCNKCVSGLQNEIGGAIGSSKASNETKQKEKEKFRVIDRYDKR